MTGWLCDRPKLRLLVPLFVLVSVLLAALSFFGILPGGLKVVKEILFFLTIFLFPGYLLWRYLSPGAGVSKRGEAPAFDHLEQVPLYFSFSVAFWSGLGLAYFYLYLPLDYIIGLFLVILLALTVKEALSKGGPQPASDDVSPCPKGPILWYYLALGVVVAVFAGLLWLAAPYQQADFDTYFHVAAVRKIAERSVWLNADQFLGNGAPAQLPYAANSWYLMLAVFSRISHLDITQIYVMTVVLLSVVAVLAFYLVVKTLLASKLLSLLATIAYVFYLFVVYTYQVSGVFTVLYPTFMPYPGEMLRFIIFPVMFAVLVKYIVSGHKPFLLALALLAVALVTVHLQFLIYVALTLGSIGLLLLILIKRYKQHFFRAVIASLVIGGASLVFFLPKVLFANSAVASSYMELPFWLNPDVVQKDYLFVTKDLYLLNFSGLFARTGVHFLLSLLVLPLIFLPQLKVDRLKAVLFSSVVVLLFIIYNPLVVPLLVKTISWVVPRRIAAFSHWAIYFSVSFAVFALLVTYPLTIWKKNDKLALLPLAITIVLAVLIASLPVFATPVAKAVNNGGHYANITELREEGLFRFLNTQVEPESVIAADLGTSYLIAALTGQYVIAVTPNRMGVGGEAALVRFMDALNISSLNLPLEELKKTMSKYGSKYIVVSPDYSKRLEAFAGSLNIVYDAAGWKVVTFR